MQRIAAASPGAASWPAETSGRLEQSGLQGWVIELGGEVVGFLLGRVMADEAEILNLAVLPEHRRRGCATALLQAAIREFRRQGARHIWLEVRHSNAEAIRLYKSYGFRSAGVRPDYYAGAREAAVCMTLKLTGSSNI